jgi:VIT1/CCC1 family predicted Fe2+/Mn2+ transporter
VFSFPGGIPSHVAPETPGSIQHPRPRCPAGTVAITDDVAGFPRLRRLVRPLPSVRMATRAPALAREVHLSHRSNWLRASVLGANDGIVSTASLVLGVAASGASSTAIVTAGIAGLVAGALSMAAGEYVSVSSQADTERADLELEPTELASQPGPEEDELAAIYVGRGVEPGLARTVAQQLMKHDALGAHARDELGLSEKFAARPLQAALASALTFSVGAALPILAVFLSPHGGVILIVSGASLICLAGLGALAARAGGASPWVGAGRVTLWGALAMAITAGAGALFRTRVS